MVIQRRSGQVLRGRRVDSTELSKNPKEDHYTKRQNCGYTQQELRSIGYLIDRGLTPGRAAKTVESWRSEPTSE